MKCNQVQPNLLDYSLGTLTAGEAQDVSAHLAVCSACRELREQETLISGMLAASPQYGPKRDVWDVISTRIEAKPARTRLFVWPTIFPVRKFVAVAAAIVFLVGGTAKVNNYRTTQAHEEEQRVNEAIALIKVQPSASVESVSSTTDAMMDMVKEQVRKDEM